MARIITKFKYLKPDERNHFGGYAEYIATREGVEKIDESKRNAPATNKQKQLIKKILSDFPDSKSSLEYEDYLKEKTVGAASEFITRALEENADEMLHTKTYADYIATRPRAERFGSHGLFTDDGVAVDLKKVSDELNAHTGNVWTAIVSLRREDAERLGFENGSRWRDMLRSQAQTLSENLRIPMSNLRWFAAFHNESHHPHIHLIAYSTNPNEGYLSEKGVMALRSSFAKDIFAQDLLCEYKKQTEHRDALKVQSREVLAELIAKINGGTYDNPQVEDLLQALAKRLAVTNGKKQYGYLRKDIKEIINNIVDDLGKDERIAALYDLWYESKETALKVYSESQPERLPLSQNKEFKSVKNIVIAEAMKLNLPTDEIEETDEPTEPDREPTVEETESPDPPPPPMDEYERTVADANKGNKWSQYRAAKFMLDRDGDHYDPKKAVEYLTKSAKQGYTVAKYMLGKLYLRGEDVPKQMLHALHWLESAVKDDNQYAEYLLGKTFLKGVDVERDTDRAESLLRRSSEQGNKYAAYTLGKAYLDGDILAQNIDEAVRLLNLSASKGFAPAQFILGRLLYKGEVVPKDIKKSVEWLDRAAAQKNLYAAYLAGKIYLTEDAVKNVQKAIHSFKIAAENGNDYAEYQLGKIYLYGKDIPRDTDKAMHYLHLAAEHGNQYAAQLIHSIRVNGNWTAALASLRLLGHMARVIQNGWRMSAEAEKTASTASCAERSKKRNRLTDSNNSTGRLHIHFMRNLLFERRNSCQPNTFTLQPGKRKRLGRQTWSHSCKARANASNAPARNMCGVTAQKRLRSEEICGFINMNASVATPLTSSVDFITWTFRRPSIFCLAITAAPFRKPSRSSESRQSRSPFRRKMIICGVCMPICLTAEG